MGFRTKRADDADKPNLLVYQYRLYPDFKEPSAFFEYLCRQQRRCWNDMCKETENSRRLIEEDARRMAPDKIQAIQAKIHAARAVVEESEERFKELRQKNGLANLKNDDGKESFQEACDTAKKELNRARTALHDEYRAFWKIAGELLGRKDRCILHQPGSREWKRWTVLTDEEKERKSLRSRLDELQPELFAARNIHDLYHVDAARIFNTFQTARNSFISKKTPTARPPRFKKNGRGDACFTLSFKKPHPCFWDFFPDSSGYHKKEDAYFDAMPGDWAEPGISDREFKNRTETCFHFRIRNAENLRNEHGEIVLDEEGKRIKNPGYHEEVLHFKKAAIHRLPPPDTLVREVKLILKREDRYRPPKWFISFTLEFPSGLVSKAAENSPLLDYVLIPDIRVYKDGDKRLLSVAGLITSDGTVERVLVDLIDPECKKTILGQKEYLSALQSGKNVDLRKREERPKAEEAAPLVAPVNMEARGKSGEKTSSGIDNLFGTTREKLIPLVRRVMKTGVAAKCLTPDTVQMLDNFELLRERGYIKLATALKTERTESPEIEEIKDTLLKWKRSHEMTQREISGLHDKMAARKKNHYLRFAHRIARTARTIAIPSEDVRGRFTRRKKKENPGVPEIVVNKANEYRGLAAPGLFFEVITEVARKYEVPVITHDFSTMRDYLESVNDPGIIASTGAEEPMKGAVV